MLRHYAIGLGAIVILSVAWIGVQRAWRETFPAGDGDPDALAGRKGCHGCEDSEDCNQEGSASRDGTGTAGRPSRRREERNLSGSARCSAEEEIR